MMERNFKKEIQEAASNPIDMAEMMAQLVQVAYLQFPADITKAYSVCFYSIGLFWCNSHEGRPSPRPTVVGRVSRRIDQECCLGQ